MAAVDRVVNTLKRTFTGPTFHGPAVEQVLEGVTAEMAAARSWSDHSIWQIVEHMTFWEDAVCRWLAGERHRPADADSWTTVVDTSERAWNAARERQRSVHAALLQAVAGLDDSQLNDRPLENMPSLYGILHGVAQHNVYHAGQIAILKKAAGRKAEAGG